MMEDLLILVDENDQAIGALEKTPVHEQGLLHRAFSIFIFNSAGKLLLQQRADGKYHSPGLWTNTCCSHPRQGETVEDAVHRRLQEEMGMSCELTFQFSFIYKHEFDNGLTEHELDHVYFGYSDQQPEPNPAEVKDWKYIGMEELKEELERYPDRYSPWLNICFPKVLKSFQS